MCSVLGNTDAYGACSEPPQCPALRSRDTQLWGLGLLLLFRFYSQLWNSSHLQGSDVWSILSHTSLGGGPSGTCIITLYCCHCNIKHTELLGALVPACLRAHGPIGCCNAVGAIVCLGLLAELWASLDTAVALLLSRLFQFLISCSSLKNPAYQSGSSPSSDSRGMRSRIFQESR